MAAFSYQYHPFLLDLSSIPTFKLSEFVDEGQTTSTTTATDYFSQVYPSEIRQNVFVEVGLHESSCLSSKVSLGDEASVTENQTPDSPCMINKLDSDEQVAQKKIIPIAKKRKNRGGSSFNSVESKNAKEGKGKKQKNCNSGMSGGEENKLRGQAKTVQKYQKEDPEQPPKGYIHVRARRGQATDSHSLAERVRRERISERMKLLQAIVPGCDKITGKALMLDEIINYVQSLQHQVEFLSMKLASLNPMLYDFGMDLEALLMRPERLSSLESPLPSGQQISPTQPTVSLDHTTTNFITTRLNDYSLLESSLALQGRPNNYSQDNGSLLWDIEDGQSQKFINQFGVGNAMCSFH